MELRTLLPLFVLAALACDRGDAGRPQPAPTPAAPAVQQPAPAKLEGAGTRGASPVAAAGGSAGADTPSQRFAGRLHLSVKGAGAPLSIRLATRGERSRIEVERAKGAKPVTLLLTGDDVVVELDDATRSYSSRRWSQIQGRQEQEPDVQVERSQERRVVSGLACQVWHVTVEPQRVEACVRAAPLELEPDKLETLARVNLPMWAERVLEEGYLPVQATVRDGARELYRVELSEYSPEQASESDVAAPAAYKERKPTG